MLKTQTDPWPAKVDSWEENRKVFGIKLEVVAGSFGGIARAPGRTAIKPGTDKCPNTHRNAVRKETSGTVPHKDEAASWGGQRHPSTE